MPDQPAQPLPQVTIDLANYQHRNHTGEWRYGDDRGLWTGGYPVIAQHGDEHAPTAVFITGLTLQRDQLPEVIAWLTAVYQATAGCCPLHNDRGCCDPEDCGPCCPSCPTCPTVRAGDTPAALTG